MSQCEDYYYFSQIDLKWCCTAKFNQSTLVTVYSELFWWFWIVISDHQISSTNPKSTGVSLLYPDYSNNLAWMLDFQRVDRIIFFSPGLVSDVFRDWLRPLPGRRVNISHWGVLTGARADCGLMHAPQIIRLGCVVNSTANAPDYSFSDLYQSNLQHNADGSTDDGAQSHTLTSLSTPQHPGVTSPIQSSETTVDTNPVPLRPHESASFFFFFPCFPTESKRTGSGGIAHILYWRSFITPWPPLPPPSLPPSLPVEQWNVWKVFFLSGNRLNSKSWPIVWMKQCCFICACESTAGVLRV